MDQLQPALAALLDVSIGTVSRWETGAEPIQRQTQLAVLLLLERTLRNGTPVPRSGRDELGARWNDCHQSRWGLAPAALERRFAEGGDGARCRW